MRFAPTLIAVSALAALGLAVATAQTPATQPANTGAITFSTGWTLLKEGEAEGVAEQDAAHADNKSPHLVRIQETRAAAPGKGRVGAINSTPVSVQADQWYDITFTAVTERGSIGLVFSLESKDGTVLARTTLPEIGRGGGRGRGRGRGGPAPATGAASAPASAASAPAPAAPPVAWTKYLVSLHARGTDPAARLTITPIEPTNIWLDTITLTPRR